MEKLHRMEGVGPTTGQKLRSAGYTSYDQIVTMSPSGLSSQLGISVRSAEYVVEAARTLHHGAPISDDDDDAPLRDVAVRSATQPRVGAQLREGLRRFGENVRRR
ncbi:hypothetical protein HN371_19825 [Candidatus Poribacteria bacterium]|nr:hypothetical protein [Candidatus Poribacteria bacterium]MBT5532866.1 hypothetical protein [Candidatus Poribacteria bacterium]MBT5709875.1 hypothetical protein [Candidatus Poribacteria bacterium]MBT7099260.1 hypothetical protein [Candidatus Poribacteria bacterium]MBT7804541.1 hypothetical protein [Candidatus Poribacteria bacterium]